MTEQHIERLNLGRFHWKNRVLLIFAPSAEADPFRAQLDALAGHEAGLIDRDLVRFHLFAEGESVVIEHPNQQMLTVEPDVVTSARKGYGVDTETLTVILIGKDGSQKERWQEPVAAETLFAIIDAMPMRQEEEGSADR